MYTLRGYTAHI